MPAAQSVTTKLLIFALMTIPGAVAELARVLRTHRAFVHMSNGDLAIEAGNTEAALREYSAAEAMFPNNLEMKYWKAVALANAGRVAESLPIFKQVFTADINWKILTPRLIGNGLLNVSTEDLREITAQ
jgi:tetratricopeptide (TPR) repeat protein